MAKPRMDLSAFVGKLLEEQDGEVLREGIRVRSQALMETEVAGLIGAERHERSQDRAAYRNGYRTRTWDTRVGTIELAIPKVRPGTYFPSLLQPRRRAEHGLLAVVQEAYVHGVSTRKVDDLVRALGIDGLSKSEVSRICAELDPLVEAFRTRALTGEYPYVWVDATYHKVRVDGRVTSRGHGRGDRHQRRGRAPRVGDGRRAVGGSRLLDGLLAECGEARAARRAPRGLGCA
jgi:putative transposase